MANVSRHPHICNTDVDRPSKLNAEQSRRTSTALNGAGIERSAEREVLRALWEVGRGFERFTCYNRQIAAAAGKSERWVERWLPAVMETQERMRLFLVERTAKGSLNRYGGEARPSEYDASGMREVIGELDRQRPVSDSACRLVGLNVAAKLRTPPTKDEPPPPPPPPPKPLPTMARSVRTIERAARDLIARAEADGSDELPDLDYVARLLDSIYEERRSARLTAIEGTSGLASARSGGVPESLQSASVASATLAVATTSGREKEKAISVPADDVACDVPLSFTSEGTSEKTRQPSTSEEEFLAVKAVLEGVKEAGAGATYDYRAKCPAHDDAHASLTVSRGTKVPVVWNCKAKCSQEAVRVAIENLLVGRRVEPKARGVVRAPRPKASAPVRRAPVEARYVRTDEEGVPLSRQTRYEGKEFGEERYEGGRWIKGLGDVRRVLYRLRELVESYPSRTVYITEGMKDCDRLAALDLVATTSGGVNSWRDEFAEFLRGREVVILPDADAPGRAFAEEIAASLQGEAHSVRVVHLWPDREDGSDVSDWLNAGHTIGEEIKLVDAIVDDPIACDECGDFGCSCRR